MNKFKSKDICSGSKLYKFFYFIIPNYFGVFKIDEDCWIFCVLTTFEHHGSSILTSQHREVEPVHLGIGFSVPRFASSLMGRSFSCSLHTHIFREREVFMSLLSLFLPNFFSNDFYWIFRFDPAVWKLMKILLSCKRF